MRAFFMALFGIIGITVGIILSLVMIGSIIKSGDSLEKKTFYKPFVIPNAQGERTILDNEAPIILKIDIEGAIGTELLSMGTIQQQLTESREGVFKDNRVKAILLSINSPGGTVIDSDSIYNYLKEYKNRYNVPIYAHVDGLCASGGMYIAAAADKIYCSDVSLIGSIGVLSPPFFNVSKILEKYEIETLVLSEGKGKDNLNPFRTWKSGESENYREILDYYYNSFVNIITENRPKIDKEKLIEEYGAKVFPADTAQEIGLVDEKGLSFYGAVEKIAQDLSLENEKYQVVQLKSKLWYSGLFQQGGALEMVLNGKKNWLMPNLPCSDRNPFMYLYIP
ncbi:MAG: S49 family peptidase [Waddliaceae bacterium]